MHLVLLLFLFHNVPQGLKHVLLRPLLLDTTLPVKVNGFKCDDPLWRPLRAFLSAYHLKQILEFLLRSR
jgi:hypothetical protein